MSDVCGVEEGYCVCALPAGHEDPAEHRCECGGSWTFDADGRFVPLTDPGTGRPFEVVIGDLLSDPLDWIRRLGWPRP